MTTNFKNCSSLFIDLLQFAWKSDFRRWSFIRSPAVHKIIKIVKRDFSFWSHIPLLTFWLCFSFYRLHGIPAFKMEVRWSLGYSQGHSRFYEISTPFFYYTINSSQLLTSAAHLALSPPPPLNTLKTSCRETGRPLEGTRSFSDWPNALTGCSPLRCLHPWYRRLCCIFH